MTLFEILLMSIGALIFVVSFFIPDKRGKEGDLVSMQFTEEQIKRLVEKEIESSKDKIIDMVDESVTYGMERTERAMERVSNEKIMAVSEYSDTVLNTIHKNHEEAVFLYDMLNDKHTNLKSTAADVENAAKEAKQILPTLEEYTDRIEKHEKDMRTAAGFTGFDNSSFDRITVLEPEPAPQYDDYAKSQVTLEMERQAARQKQAEILEQLASATSASDIDMNGGKPKKKAAPLQPVGRQAVLQELSDNAKISVTPETSSNTDFESDELVELKVEDYIERIEQIEKNDAKINTPNASAQRSVTNNVPQPKAEPEISFGRASGNGGINSNERILALHKKGKSNMAIAKELGLGVGEVNLVLGLFKG